jgi:hypothetical protein
MGTRSTIALEFADGTVQQVYCHWDGYLENNGTILAEHYSDPFKLRDLTDMGDMSSLGKVIGMKHPFGPAYNETDALKKAKVQKEVDEAREAGYTTFYGRDRGEEGCEAKKFKDIADYRENVQGEEYDYILCQREGKAVWFVRSYATDGNWVALDVAFEEQAKAALVTA